MSEQRDKVLIVDDERFNINVLVDLLSPEYDTMVAKSGKQALSRVNSATPPDLILLDIMMPEMDGYEVCRRLKEDESTCNIPIIFVTAMGDSRDEAKGLEIGAVDYITKPVSPPIVQARVKTQLTLNRTRQELLEKNQLLLTERELIEHVVSKMRQSVRYNGRHLRSYISPMEKTTGDLLLSAFRPDGSQHVLVGDFTGHGLTAAIAGPIVSDLFYAATTDGTKMDHIVKAVNLQLCDVLPVDRFLVGCFLEISPDRRHLRAWNCAMPDAVLFRGGTVHTKIASNNLPRGVLDLPDQPGVEIDLEAGDLIFACSDGITEERDPTGKMFGDDRYELFLSKLVNSGLPLEQIGDILRDFRRGREQGDDIIMLELSC